LNLLDDQQNIKLGGVIKYHIRLEMLQGSVLGYLISKYVLMH